MGEAPRVVSHTDGLGSPAGAASPATVSQTRTVRIVWSETTTYVAKLEVPLDWDADTDGWEHLVARLDYQNDVWVESVDERGLLAVDRVTP